MEVRDVRNGHQSLAPDASNIFRGRLCLLAVDIDDADVGPFAGKTCGDGLADSLAGSSNDGDLSLKSHFPSSSPAASDPILERTSVPTSLRSHAVLGCTGHFFRR